MAKRYFFHVRNGTTLKASEFLRYYDRVSLGRLRITE
jgi:hypothetical protein